MVYIFKTTVEFKLQIKTIASHLNGIQQIDKWNFDLADCDKILRIEAATLDADMVCKLLKSFRFECVEL